MKKNMKKDISGPLMGALFPMKSRTSEATFTKALKCDVSGRCRYEEGFCHFGSMYYPSFESDWILSGVLRTVFSLFPKSWRYPNRFDGSSFLRALPRHSNTLFSC